MQLYDNDSSSSNNSNVQIEMQLLTVFPLGLWLGGGGVPFISGIKTLIYLLINEN